MIPKILGGCTEPEDTKEERGLGDKMMGSGLDLWVSKSLGAF